MSGDARGEGRFLLSHPANAPLSCPSSYIHFDPQKTRCNMDQNSKNPKDPNRYNSASCWSGVPEHVCTFLTRENLRKPFMYKYYLMKYFYMEASNNTRIIFVIVVLAKEYKLVGFLLF